MKIIPVILSGGSGKRLWPLSRLKYPKQYLALIGDNTMLQETILRLSGLEYIEDPIIICNSEHRFLVADQCQQININNPTILLEPEGRNTAPAIAAAAFQILKEEDALMLVLPADHTIKDLEAFHRAVEFGYQQAIKGKLVTFGIEPTDANSSYGYIKASRVNSDTAYKVEKFVEKPDQETAKKFISQGSYYWNSGMFMFNALQVVDELRRYSPKIGISANESVNKASIDLDFIRLDAKAFESSPNDSIDYALMEKSNNSIVIPLKAGWSDIGAWTALHDIGEKDKNENVIKGNVIVEDTINTYVNADKRLVVAIGLDNLIIVDTPDVTLVAEQSKAYKVQNIVESLKLSGRNEGGEHRKVYRPWGWYDVIESGEYFQVKRLHVKSGSKLSLQMHHKRAEHWTVVSGSASVTNGNQTFILEKGESTFIPLGATHSLENKLNEPLEVIEVQSGTYLGEDDIVRFEDIYGRIR
jgi:mannose-1-phosphate guanylyltransferase/mannose-6-phosphate isomerase